MLEDRKSWPAFVPKPQRFKDTFELVNESNSYEVEIFGKITILGIDRYGRHPRAWL